MTNLRYRQETTIINKGELILVQIENYAHKLDKRFFANSLKETLKQTGLSTENIVKKGKIFETKI